MPGSAPDRIPYYGLLLLLVWVPLPLGSNRAWAWVLLELGVQLLAAACLVLLLLGRLRISASLRRAWPAILLFSAWLLYLLVQLLPLPLEWIAWLSPGAHAVYLDARLDRPVQGGVTLSLDPWATRSFLLRSWAYFLLFCLVLQLVNSPQRMRLLVMVLVFGGVFQALFGSFMVLSGVERLLFGAKEAFVGQATGTFVNRNHLAGHLEMCIALGVGWLVAGGDGGGAVHWKQRVRNGLKFLLSGRMRLRLMLVIMAIGLVMTHSRMGNVAFLSSLLVAAVVWLLLRRRRPKRGAVLVIGSILALDILVMGHWFGLEKVVSRLQNTSLQTEVRDDVLKDSVRYAQDYWLTGSGGGSFYSTFPAYMGEGVSAFYRYAHNDYLQFLLETGVIGLSLLGLLCVGSLVAALRAMALRTHPYLRRIAYGSFMGQTALLIHSSADFNLQIPANAALFVVLLALAWLALRFPGRAGAHSGASLHAVAAQRR